MLKARQLTTFGLKTLDGETCYSMLKKFMPPKFKEELLWEGVLDSIQQFIHA